MSNLTGKVAVVTGGNSGIGLASAKRLVAEGAHVYIVGRREDVLASAKAEIGGSVSTIRADITNLADLERLYDTVKREKGGIDILVAAAGAVELRTFADSTPEHFDWTFGMNVRGTYFTVQKALPVLRDKAAIVVVSSIAHMKGIPVYNAYSGAKAALRAFVRSWAAELKERGIRVNTLSPGPIDTPMFDQQFTDPADAQGARASFVSMMPLGRMGQPDEMASAVYFLASDESSFVTGIDLVADGGLTQV